MAIPDYQSVMLPLLRLAESRNEELSTDEAVEALAIELIVYLIVIRTCYFK